MRKKGFTLIELLAVILILGIIALIAIPVVNRIIKKSREDASLASVKQIIKAAENYYAIGLINNSQTVLFDGKTNLLPETLANLKGAKPSQGNLYIDKKGNVSLQVVYGEYCFIKNFDSDDIDIKNSIDNCFSEENIEIPINNNVYRNGHTIYFNPTTGLVCDDYVSSNSNDGNKAGCLKWYVFLDEAGATKINLLLDHNTTTNYSWNASNSNNNSGPDSNFLNKLKNDTAGWLGIPDRTDYYEVNEGVANYKIDYTGYKARLISMEEIALITGNQENWSRDGSIGSFLRIGTSKVCTSIDIEGCSNSWLYDRTSYNCKEYGCLNNGQNSSMWGYWTITPNTSNSKYAWYLYNQGNLDICNIQNSSLIGIRPVITIPKASLNN